MLNMLCLDEAFKKKFRIRREKAICSGHVFFNSYFNVQHINLMGFDFSSSQQKHHMKENISFEFGVLVWTGGENLSQFSSQELNEHPVEMILSWPSLVIYIINL